MSTRKATVTHVQEAAPAPRPRKKPRAARGPRIRYTHFEIRRGDAVILRVAVADNALADVGDELGALVKRIAPSTQTSVVAPVTTPVATPVAEVVQFPAEPAFVFGRAHTEHDAAYHDELRGHLVELFSSLCDTALEAALDVARQERDRRAEGGN